jgi:hypothetical protein
VLALPVTVSRVIQISDAVGTFTGRAEYSTTHWTNSHTAVRRQAHTTKTKRRPGARS